MPLIAVTDTFECGWCPKRGTVQRDYIPDPGHPLPEGWRHVSNGDRIWETRPAKRGQFVICMDLAEVICGECWTAVNAKFQAQRDARAAELKAMALASEREAAFVQSVGERMTGIQPGLYRTLSMTFMVTPPEDAK